MPKRSLKPGNHESKKIEQLNNAIDAILARSNSKPPKVGAGIEPLVRIAAELRNLPSASFKARLKSQFEGEKKMATLTVPSRAVPAAAVGPSATPRLTFKHTAEAISFYKKAFGAQEIFRFDTPAGIPAAEIRIGNSVIDLTDEWPEGGRLSAETLGSSPVQMNLEVANVDAAFERAVAAGMTVRMGLKNEFYGHRKATLDDPFGYTWNVYTVIEEMSVAEMHRRMPAPAKEERPAVNPVPRGFLMVTPYIIAADGDAMLAFARNAFGAKETFRAIGGAGGIHGEVRIGDTMLMMGGGIPGKAFAGKANATALHIYVEDTDAVYRKALDAGATSLSAPQDQAYGERGASVRDPFGNFWYIATHKGESYVSEGMHNVNVYMHPLRAEPVISFLKRAFGAEERARYASPDGVVHHAVIRVGDSVLEMGEAHGPYQPMQSMFYVYVADCDAVYRRALAAGGKSIHEPQDAPYGDRIGGVSDPFGNQWWIATPVKGATRAGS